ncbi:hypothetical protein C8R43DRAFT_1132025 [Mycena crocata]|nr:hypothetical protein C8R43DRAFT_1132025 [Mycena crocata]
MYIYTPPATPAPKQRPNAIYEAPFAEGIFDEVFNVPPAEDSGSKGTPKPRRSRALGFSWPTGTTQEDRLLVAFRCMQKAGFETVGDYFAAVLGDDNNTHQAVYQSVTAFLQCRGVDVRTHPMSIIERIFQDPRSKKRFGVDENIHFDLPCYALPPSQRLLPTLPKPQKNTTRNSLINFALQVIVARWQEEADLLLDPVFGFVRQRKRDEPAEKFSWFDILNWSMTRNQEIVAGKAPVIFTCMTSVAVNDNARKKLEKAAEGNAVPADPGAATNADAPHASTEDDNPCVHSPDSESGSDLEDDGEEVLTSGVPPRMTRDPWLTTSREPP